MKRAESLDLARDAVGHWLREGVLRHQLCPFAQGPVARDGVHIQSAEGQSLEGAASDAILAAHALLDHGATDTTLVVFPFALDDFEDFLDAIATCEAYLEDQDLSSRLQVATFHPEYRFDGVEADAPSNFTNRAPLPILQWLRVDQVSEGVDAHGDIASIPTRNMALMDSLHRDAREALRALPGTRVVEGPRANWDTHGFTHFVEERSRVVFGRQGIASTRVFAPSTYIDAGEWTLHVRAGEVLSRP